MLRVSNNRISSHYDVCADFDFAVSAAQRCFLRTMQMQAQTQTSAIDPIPLTHLTLSEVVALRTAAISNRDIAIAAPEPLLQQMLGPSDGPLRSDCKNSSGRHEFAEWRKREQAILEITQALASANLSAMTWEPALGSFDRLLPEDWRQAAFHDQIVRSGFVRASAGESIGRHEGRRPLLEKANVLQWLSERQRSKRRPAASDCAVWLQREMLASPEHKPRPKLAYRHEALDFFGVSGRQFSGLWKSAIAKTGARWDRPGRPANSGC
jgi:hypothetical protein